MSCFCILGRGYKHSNLSFLFSLRNKENRAPFIANVISEQYAVYADPNHGPAFGGGHDVYISDNAAGNQGSYSNFGDSYRRPSRTDNSLLAGSYHFTPTEIEVFI